MSLVSAVVGLADNIVGLISYEKRTKYRDKFYEIKKGILDEELKPVSEQNDARLETLYQNLELTLEALSMEPITLPPAPPVSK